MACQSSGLIKQELLATDNKATVWKSEWLLSISSPRSPSPKRVFKVRAGRDRDIGKQSPARNVARRRSRYTRALPFHAHILHSDQNRSVIEVFRAISAKSARSGPSVPSPRQNLYGHLKVELPPATLRNDNRLRFSPVPRAHRKTSKKASVVMKVSCPASVLGVQTIPRYHPARTGRPRQV